MTAQPLIAHARRRSSLMLLGGALCLTALFGWCVWKTIDAPHGTFGWLAFIGGCLALFGYCSALAIVRLIRNEPVLRIDAAGVTLPSMRLAVPWSAFERAELSEIQGYSIIGFRLIDAEAPEHDPRLRKMARVNREYERPDLGVCAAGTDRSFDELVEAARTHAPQLFAVAI